MNAKTGRSCTEAFKGEAVRVIWESGHPVAPVARLIRWASLCGVPQRRRWRTKPSGIPLAGTRNHRELDFTATAPNIKWVTDITYVRIA